jgi:hypothetical protein
MTEYATFLLVFWICVGFWTRGEVVATALRDNTHESETRASKFGTLARAGRTPTTAPLRLNRGWGFD